MAETDMTEAESDEHWPDGFLAHQMPVTDGTQYVRVGGQGPAVILLHGFGDTGDMWVPLAARLVTDHSVMVPDLRGMGLSSHPEGGYQKVAQARDLAAILDQLGVKEALSSPTTSAIWSATPLRRSIPSASRSGWSWTHPCLGSVTGTIS